MGKAQDVKRFREVAENRRMDLEEFMRKGDMGDSIPGEDDLSIPIKQIELPNIDYDMLDAGGVGQMPPQGPGQQGQGQGQPQPGQGQPQPGQPQPGMPGGQPVPIDGDGDGDGDGEDGEEGEPGEGGGEHEYYEMDPEEFAEELDDKYGLDMEPKGAKVKEEVEGALKKRAMQGPDSMLDKDHMIKEGIKMGAALHVDKDYLREALRIEGMGPKSVYEWVCTEKGMNVNMTWLERAYEQMKDQGLDITHYDDADEFEEENTQQPFHHHMRRGGEGIEIRDENLQYMYPEINEEYEKNAVIFNLRDVSGSMGQQKRDLVERTFTTLDYYLKGKYDTVEFVYIAHDFEAWECDPQEFFGINSGGGTKISSAYELAKEIQEDQYPEDEWNIYVFGAGDGENSSRDTEQEVIPLMNEIPANTHSYIITQPGGGSQYASHGEELRDAKENNEFVYPVNVSDVNSRDDVSDAVVDTLEMES